MHPWLAILCFFRVLFGRPLPPEVLPPPPEPPKKELPPAPAPDKKEAAPPKVSGVQQQRDGALSLLALLQREGRFVDFVRDSVDGASDADIGAAAREVHRGCKKVIEQHMKLEPVMPGAEDEKVAVPKGFDPR